MFRIARTIADLAGRERIEIRHLAEAIEYNRSRECRGEVREKAPAVAEACGASGAYRQ